MEKSISETDLVNLVKKLTDPNWIGVIGSAAGRGSAFTDYSDVDVIVEHDNHCQFLYGTLGTSKVEVHQYSKTKINDILANPQWFGTDWVWELGKFFEAETLFGNRPNLNVAKKSRLISLIAAVGKISNHINKLKQGRKCVGDNSHEFTALRHLVDKTYPKAYKNDASPVDLSYVDKIEKELAPILSGEIENILFFPEHWEGAAVLSARWGLSLSIPNKGKKY